MPLKRRVPKRGFTNIFKKVEWAIVNLRDLNRLESVQDVTPQVLARAGLVSGREPKIKVLGEGTPARPFHIKAHRFSASAIAKIQAAGGRVEVLDSA
jgi:large subunit ribosomal protein L15